MLADGSQGRKHWRETGPTTNHWIWSRTSGSQRLFLTVDNTQTYKTLYLSLVSVCVSLSLLLCGWSMMTCTQCHTTLKQLYMVMVLLYRMRRAKLFLWVALLQSSVCRSGANVLHANPVIINKIWFWKVFFVVLKKSSKFIFSFSPSWCPVYILSAIS